MKRITTAIILLFSICAYATNFPAVFAPIAGYEKTTDDTSLVQGLVDQLILKHNERFDDQGNLVATPEQTQDFISLQTDTLQKLKDKNGYKLLFPITNNLMTSANAQAYFVVNEQNELLALSFDGQTPKPTTEELSILRIRPVHYLSQTQSVIGLDGSPVMVIESKTADWTTGGDIKIYCVLDKNKKKFGSLTVHAGRNDKDEWGLYYKGQVITQMYLKLWVNIFTADGGITDVTINGTTKVTMDPVARNKFTFRKLQ